MTAHTVFQTVDEEIQGGFLRFSLGVTSFSRFIVRRPRAAKQKMAMDSEPIHRDNATLPAGAKRCARMLRRAF